MAGQVERCGVGEHVQRAVHVLFNRRIGGGQWGRHEWHGRHHQHVEVLEHFVVLAGEFRHQHARLGVVGSVQVVQAVMPGQCHGAYAAGQRVGVFAPLGTEVAHDLGVVVAVNVHAVAIALQHLVRRAVSGDDVPHVQRHPVVPRHACLADRGPEAFQLCHGGFDQRVHLRLGHAGDGEAFAQQADFQARNALIQGRDTTDCWRILLPGIETVCTGDHVEHHRAVAHVIGHRADVIDGPFNRKSTGVRHQAVRRLVPDDAAPRRGHAD